MIFIFGGAYQGMEEYAQNELGAGEICVLTEDTREFDFRYKAFTGIERFVLGCVRRGESAKAYLESNQAMLESCILIGMDLSCGVVPMDAQLRAWRDENGRVNNHLAAQADSVVRLFCGIAQKIK